MSLPFRLLSLLCLFPLIACNGRLSPTATAEAQIGTRIESRPHESFRFSDLTGLPSWDRLIILGPGSTQDDADRLLGFHWEDFHGTDLRKSGSIHVAMFLNGRELVRFEEWERSRFEVAAHLRELHLSPTQTIRFDHDGSVPTLVKADLPDDGN